MIAVPFRIVGKYKGAFEASLQREYRFAFGRAMQAGEIVYPGTTRIVYMRGEFTSVKLDADGSSFQIEGVYGSDVAPYGYDLGVALAHLLGEKMKFMAKAMAKDAVYRGAPKGTKVIVGTPKVTAASVPIGPIANPSKRRGRRPAARRRNPDHIHAITPVTVGGSRRVWTLCGAAKTPDDVKVTDKTRHAYGVTCPICVRAFEMRRGFDAAREERRRAPQRNPSPKPRTYAEARADILRALRADGWDVRENLKVPHATHSSGDFRLWFKTQAIYFTTGDRRRGQGTLGDAYSLHMGDIRAMPVAEVMADLERARRTETGR